MKKCYRDRFDAHIDNVRPVEHGDKPFDQRVQRLATAFQSVKERAQTHKTTYKAAVPRLTPC